MKKTKILKSVVSIICTVALILSINVVTVTVDAATTYNSAVVNAIIEGLKAFKTRIDLAKYNLSADDFGNLYLDIIYDNPELFHVKTGYSYSINSVTEIVTAVSPVYILTSEEYKTKIVEFDNAVADYLSYISDDMTDFTKALILHDLLVRRCVYSSDYYLGNTIPNNCYTAYGALVEKEAVCQGYSLAYHYILDKCGVESDYAVSDAMNHIWNLVKIGGNYYHVDVTWDDSRYVFGSDKVDLAGVVQHKNFLVTDTEIENNKHYNWKADYKATSTAYSNSFVRNIANTGVSYYGGYYYYINSSGVLVKQQQSSTSTQTVYEIPTGRWNETGISYKPWRSNYSRVYTVGNNIYFTECKRVLKLNLAKDTEAPVVIGTPTLDNDECLYGLEIVNNKGYCDVLNASNNISCREQFDLVTTSYDFTVTAKDSSGKTLGSSFTGYVGDTVTLTITSTSGNADTYSVTLSNPDVAKYNATGGKITLTAAGSTKITVKSNSDASCVQTLSLTVSMKKAATPSAPTLKSKTESSVTLNPVSGCEYSMDKVNWQKSNVFNNLSVNKDYSFYMRVAATGNVLASDASAALTVRINKASTPSAPTLQSKTESSVTLNPVSGCEYSMDKVNWQTSNVFNNLESDRDYTFYVRVAATTDVFASDIASITVHLSSTNKVVYGDCNYDGKINLLDLIVIRKHLAKWSISIDQTAADCNGDGKLNLLDLIVMRKYLAKWNIVLGPQK